MQNCGDWIEGAQVRFHHSSPHMIVVAETLTVDFIHQALRGIEAEGSIKECRACGPGRPGGHGGQTGDWRPPYKHKST